MGMPGLAPGIFVSEAFKSASKAKIELRQKTGDNSGV
jgi:hypothetical protein